MNPPAAPDDALSRVAQQFIASRFLTLSILLHAVFVLMVGGTVLYHVAADAPDFEAGGDGFLVEASTQAELPPLPSANQPLEQQFTPQPPALEAPLTALVSNTQLPPTWTVKIVPNAPIRGLSDSMKGALQAMGNRAGQAGGYGNAGFGRAGGTGTGMLFGRSIMAKRLGVILDVSGSAQPYLAGAVDEIQKGFGDAIMILYPGCGMIDFEGNPEHEIRKFSSIPPSELSNTAFLTTASWLEDALRIEAFDRMTKRPTVKETLFVSWYDSRAGSSSRLVGRTQVAFEDLMKRGVDTIYWFCDFEDPIDPRIADRLVETLKTKRIKVHLHNFASDKFNDEAKLLAEKTGGTMITSKP